MARWISLTLCVLLSASCVRVTIHERAGPYIVGNYAEETDDYVRVTRAARVYSRHDRQRFSEVKIGREKIARLRVRNPAALAFGIGGTALLVVGLSIFGSNIGHVLNCEPDLCDLGPGGAVQAGAGMASVGFVTALVSWLVYGLTLRDETYHRQQGSAFLGSPNALE